LTLSHEGLSIREQAAWPLLFPNKKSEQSVNTNFGHLVIWFLVNLVEIKLAQNFVFATYQIILVNKVCRTISFEFGFEINSK
jgi:hypothetical protein